MSIETWAMVYFAGIVTGIGITIIFVINAEPIGKAR